MRNRQILSHHLSVRLGPKLICEAVKFSRAQLVHECRQFVEKLLRRTVWELKYAKWTEIPMSPLHIAVQRGDYSIFHYLFTACPHVSSMSLLLHCCTLQSSENLNEIIDNKTQIISSILENKKEALEEKDELLQRTPLIMERIHHKLAIFLLNKNANATVADNKYNQTIAHRAAIYFSSNEFYELIQVILKSNYFQVLEMKNCMNLTPLEIALQKNQTFKSEHLQMIFKEIEASGSVKIDKESLLYAAVVGLQKEDILKLLIDNGANEFEKWSDGSTYLHISAQHGNIDALKLFTKRGCKVNHKNKLGMTPLQLAVAKGKRNIYDTVCTLLDLGADISARYKNGQNVFQYIQNCEYETDLKEELMKTLQKSEEDQTPSEFGTGGITENCHIL